MRRDRGGARLLLQPPEPPPALASVAVRDRHPPVAAEGPLGDLDPGRRLAPLVLGDVDEPDHAVDGIGVESARRRSRRGRGPPRRSRGGSCRAASYGGSESSSRWSGRSSADGGRSRIAAGMLAPARSSAPARKTSVFSQSLITREPAGRVAVERRVADRHLATCCRSSARASRTCSTAPSAGCRGSGPGCSPRSGRPARPAKTSAEDLGVGGHTGGDRQLECSRCRGSPPAGGRRPASPSDE